MYRLYELCRSAVSLVLPNRCPFCDGVIGAKEYWCGRCCGRLKFVQSRLEPPKNVDEMLSCCYYTGSARSAILRMKQGGYVYSCEALAVMMTELAAEAIAKADFVTAVPCSKWRKRQLGYAHAEKIAKNMAMRGRKQFKRVLSVTKEKQEQKRLNIAQRQENAGKSYAVREKFDISGKNILLVDDVSTTGATISVIAGLLKAAGADRVYAVTFAKTR